MKKISIILFGVVLISCSGPKNLFNTDPKYLEPVPALYQLGAHSSVQTQDAVLTFYGPHKALFKEHSIITILDEEHRDLGVFRMFYDRFRNIDYLKVQVRNKEGIVVGNYTLNDAEDYSASGNNFFSDARIKILEAYHYSYPYTLEYEYQYSYSGTLNLHDWYPKSYAQSVQESSFEIQDHANGGMRYYARNMEKDPIITKYPQYTSIRWELRGEIAQKREVYSPPYPEIFPNVVTSASQFRISNSNGDASSWKSFGEWYYRLSKGKRELPSAATEEIDRVLNGISSEREKVIALYRYMQNRTRYVSIQLGLGGWEPYPAEFVFENRYGDCKALVNFMQALLEYAGIKAEPALIRNGLGSPEVIADFPSNQFNHVVLRVTLSNGENIWLECTSKYMKPGRIGTGNEGKNALLVNEEGGKIVTTQISEPEENASERLALMSLKEDGSAIISSKVINKGEMEDIFLHRLKPISPMKREEWLQESIPLDDFKLTSYAFQGIEQESEKTGYEFDLKAERYASTTQKRLFVPVNAMNRWDIYVPDEELRVTPLQLPFRFMELDSVVFDFPSGYVIESLPDNTMIENEFGSYSLTHSMSEDKITFKRSLKVSKMHIPKEEYEEFKRFFSTINKTDQSQFVLVQD